MNELVTEGKVCIRIKPYSKISKSMEVFYNPIMKFNRDTSLLLLNSINNNKLSIGLPLAGSGVRGLRFIKELSKTKLKSVEFNDNSIKAVNNIKYNLKRNNINISSKKIRVSNLDANLFLINSKGFDYIDIDPFGTSNPFLDSAIRRISRNGVLAVTNTDTAGLSGTYPKVCKRLYWASPKLDYMMHETGLRILIRKIQLIGAQFDKALTPIFSYFKNHYFRVFFRCDKSKTVCDELIKKHEYYNNTGPLWTGNLWDSKLVNEMLKNVDSDNTELKKFLEVIKKESVIKSVGYFDIHNAAKKNKTKVLIKKEVLINRIKKKKFKAACTHFSGTGIRTNMDYNKILKIMS